MRADARIGFKKLSLGYGRRASYCTDVQDELYCSDSCSSALSSNSSPAVWLLFYILAFWLMNTGEMHTRVGLGTTIELTVRSRGMLSLAVEGHNTWVRSDRSDASSVYPNPKESAFS